MIRWIREKIEDWRYKRRLKKKRKEMEAAMKRMTDSFRTMKAAMYSAEAR